MGEVPDAARRISGDAVDVCEHNICYATNHDNDLDSLSHFKSPENRVPYLPT